MKKVPSRLVATLGAKPQLVTLALDCLKGMGDLPESVVVVHTYQERLETKLALQAIWADTGSHFPLIKLRSLELNQNNIPLKDVTLPDDVSTAFRALYAEVFNAKLAGDTVHLLIAGGRRTLAVFGMAVSQMLFDDQDHLWHLSSHPRLEESGRLHAAEGEWSRLIPIPVIPWGRLSPVFATLRTVDNPFSAAQILSELRLHEQWDLARIFVLTKLSAGELAVVELLTRDGFSQSGIAEKLGLSPRTVEQHLRSAYRKAAEHWDLEEVHQAQLIHLLNLFFTTGGGIIRGKTA
jgi:CRISPR-associated protein Csx14